MGKRCNGLAKILLFPSPKSRGFRDKRPAEGIENWYEASQPTRVCSLLERYGPIPGESGAATGWQNPGMQPCQRLWQAFIVSCQTPEVSISGKTAFNTPPAWQEDKALKGRNSL
jgi:hypothetical protein